MTYVFRPGQRVRVAGHGDGYVVVCVPGNGTFAWYFVHLDNGSEDRFTDRDLTAI